MPIKNGDFILVNYTCKIKETGDVTDTTYEAVAKETGFRREGENPEPFEPYFLIVGEGWQPKGFEEGLVGLEPQAASTIEIPPEKAFGIRDPSKVRLVPLRRFTTDGLTPTPGMHVDLGGKTAIVRTVGAGRVQVDYNHPLAGKTLVYDVKVEKLVDTDHEKIMSLIHRRLPNVKPEKFTVRIQDNELTIHVPEEGLFLEGLQVAKRAVTSDIEKYMPGISKISFIEVFKEPTIKPELTAGQP